jgi:hypothetical protein
VALDELAAHFPELTDKLLERLRVGYCQLQFATGLSRFGHRRQQGTTQRGDRRFLTGWQKRVDTTTILDTMDIFITWSGPRSLAVAEALKEYLPMIVNAFKPWLSRTNIDKGANWSAELTAALASARAGIICLTPSNLSEPWILFEAGAIAKSVTEKPLACTLLIGLKSSDLSGPLALFQDTKETKDDLLHLVKTLNNGAGEGRLEEAQVERTFDLVWPKLKERLDNLPSDGPAERPQRTDRDLLEEILDSVRGSTIVAEHLARAEESLAAINARLAAEVDLARLAEMRRMAASAETDQEMWARLGRAFASSDPALRAFEVADAEVGRQMAAVTKEARKTKAKTFLDEARDADRKAEP